MLGQIAVALLIGLMIGWFARPEPKVNKKKVSMKLREKIAQDTIDSVNEVISSLDAQMTSSVIGYYTHANVTGRLRLLITALDESVDTKLDKYSFDTKA